MKAKEWKIWYEDAQKMHKVKKVRIAQDEDGVVWLSDAGEFRIWFPPERNPLGPGSDVSAGGRLARPVVRGMRTGTNSPGGDRYYYSIYLIGKDEMVECESSPEMIVE